MLPQILFTCACMLSLGLASSPSSETAADLIYNAIVPRNGPGSVVTSEEGLTWYDPDLSCGAPGRKNVTAYTCYSGPAVNFPPRSAWLSFNNMWKVQSKYAFMANGDSKLERKAVHDGIIKISKNAKVDARVILAVIMHESFGNVRVPCTFGSVPNCGLMQSYNATVQSYNASQPRKSITQMIIDGTQGTPSGPGLVQLFNDADDTNKETGGNVYAVFRAYNSGTVNASDLSNGEGALPSYVSDMANYLQGWNGYGNGPSSCNFTSSTPTPPTPPTCISSAYVAPPTQTVGGTTADCCTWHTVVSGDNCYALDQEYGITFAQLQAWNTYINSDCTNLFLSYAYCVNSNDPVPSGSPTSSSSSSTTATSTTSSSPTTPATCVSSAYIPAPTQTLTGTTADCCMWHTAVSGDSCYAIDVEYNITFSQLMAWNTYIDSSCNGLWVGYAYCVNSNDPVSTGTTTTSSSSSTTTTTSSTSTSPTVPATCVSSAYVPAPTETRTGSTADCCAWYTVVGGDSCYSIDTANDISFAQLQAWNTYLDNNCGNLWASYAVCVDSDDAVPPSRARR